jgi:hypothetical protein
MALVRVFSPDNQPEQLAVVAMLEAHDIPCFVHNAGFGALYPGPQIHAYNTSAIMVPEEQVAEALELIRDFQAQPSDTPPPPAPPGRLRALIELLLFGWFIPGSRRRVSSRRREGE